MREVLEQLAREVADFAKPQALDEEEWQSFASECIVALPAGGEGLRLNAITAPHRSQKSALTLSAGHTMLERTIAMYRDAGLREFVALVYANSESVQRLLGDGSSLGVSIRYSHDPERPVGRGGAVRHALESGAIPPHKSLIVHNPDDQIVCYPGSFPRDITGAHLHGRRLGHLATAVLVDNTRYPYTVMQVRGGSVERVEMYPRVPLPTHVGVTLFAPEVYPYFRRLFDLDQKTDFEAILFPALVHEGCLFSAVIPAECWVAVNDPKGLRQLEAALEAEGSMSRP